MADKHPSLADGEPRVAILCRLHLQVVLGLKTLGINHGVNGHIVVGCTVIPGRLNHEVHRNE